MSFARRELSPARIGRNLRLLLARRPWIRWLTVGAIAVGAGASVQTQLHSVDAARARWTELRRVPVATATASPGERLAWEWRDLPAVGVPADVAAEITDRAVARQHVGSGEIVVRADFAVGAGPAAGADPGDVVVPVSDPLVTGASVGLAVAIYSDGLILADDGYIAHVDGDVVFVALDAADAPTVAAAAQLRQASIAFVATG